jgi:hypothetical protein
MFFEHSRARALPTTSRIPSCLCAIEEHAREAEVFNALMTSPRGKRIRL